MFRTTKTWSILTSRLKKTHAHTGGDIRYKVSQAKCIFLPSLYEFFFSVQNAAIYGYGENSKFYFYIMHIAKVTLEVPFYCVYMYFCV